MSPISRRKCLVVLGMHRSGTSSLTGALHFTGFDLGENIMPPADENPKGFFENASFVNLNDKILQELFINWSDTLFMPDEWWKSELFEKYSAQINDILSEEFTSEKPILIKDPRLSIVLPLYLDVFKKAEINPVFLICVRNPFEVASSLNKRNNMPQEKSILLWMDYQLKAELYTRELPRLFVSYADFLRKPLDIINKTREVFSLDMVQDNKTLEEIHSFLDPALSHQIPDGHMPEISQIPELTGLYKLQAAAGGRDLTAGELAAVDHIRTRFISLARFYNGLAGNSRATLTVQFENGEKTVITAPVKFGANILTFAVDQGIPVKGIILRPCNSRVGIRIQKAEACLTDHTIVGLGKINSNASVKDAEGLHLFDTDLPKIVIEFEHPLSLSRIDFQVSYLVFGIISSRKATWKQSKTNEKKDDKPEPKPGIEIQKLQDALEHQKREIEKIHNSLSWKAGRLITAPARLFSRRFKK